MPTIGQILERNARRVPDRTALVYGELRYSYKELDGKVNQTANALSRLGVCKGHRVALMAFNSHQFVTAYYALLKLGAIVVPINVRLAPPEVAYQLLDAGANLFLCDADLATVAEIASAEAEEAGMHAAVVQLSGDGADTLTKRAEQESTEAPNVTVHEDDDAQILYTSGTTGKPKGVLLDHHRIIWTGINITTGVGLKEGERLLHVAPLYHSAELDLFLMAGTFMAATHVVMKDFHPTHVLKAMEAEKITAFFGVPTMYQFMLRDPLFDTLDLSHWRVGMFGAAPMPPSAVTALSEKVRNVTLYNLCGLTEMGPGGVFLGGQELVEHPNAAGRAIINTESIVAGDDGTQVSPGEVGELWLRGETLMKGYWNNPEATEATMRDGWLMTGDLATLDEDGRVIMIDRKKDMILTGGMNVYSVEVEYAVITHPNVADCAVIGIPHPDYGETVTVVVTPTPGSEITLEEIRAHCQARIADYKIPRRLIVAPIPRNASGKVLKYQLRETYREPAHS